MFERATKSPISNTSNELVAVDFAGYRDLATFLHIRDTFRDSRRLCFRNEKSKKNKRQKW